MGSYIYDDALLEKIKSWTSDTNVHFYGPDDTRRLFEVIADETNDRPIKLPIICLRRNGGYTINNINKRPLTYDSHRIIQNEESSLLLDAIPITIYYQIDVYTRYMREADAYVRDLIFNFINHPTLYITVPYQGVNYKHQANMRIAADVEDNSSIPERLIPGQFTRMTLNVNIDDAYLWDAKVRRNISIDSEEGLILTSRNDPSDTQDDLVETI